MPRSKSDRHTGSRSVLLQVRISPEEMEQLRALAGERYLSDWIRERLILTPRNDRGSKKATRGQKIGLARTRMS